MIKNSFFSIVFFLLTFLCYGQRSMKIEEFTTSEKVFEGAIEKGVKITVYLNFYGYSSGHSNIYSVKGWYFYNNYREKIPLVGVYNNGYTLYKYDNEKKRDTVLNFLYDDYDKRSFWEAQELYTKMDGYTEKFEISNDDGPSGNYKFVYVGKWFGNDKILPAKFYAQELGVLQKYSFLNIEDGKKSKHINLEYLGIYPEGNSIWKYKWENGQLRVLLQYDHISKSYALGMCGAGNESGIIYLEFDSDYNLIEMKDMLTDSCLLGITTEMINQTEKSISYKTNYGNDKKDTFFTVDLKNVSITENEN